MCVADVYLICNYGILPAWALLVAAPRSVWTHRVVHSMLLPLLLASVYIAAFLANDEPLRGDFGTLEGVMKLFTEPWIVVAGWVHYLVFDLFVGAWEVRDAERSGIRHLYVVPALLFTLMLGPVGLAMYLLLRFALTKQVSLAERAGDAAVEVA